MIILDTNVFIDYLRGYQPAIKFFESLDHQTVLFSAITETELIAGKECSDTNNKERLLRLLNCFEKIFVTNQIAVLAGDICREYETWIADSIIAATAILTKSELLTKNLKDFQKIRDLKVKVPY